MLDILHSHMTLPILNHLNYKKNICKWFNLIYSVNKLPELIFMYQVECIILGICPGYLWNSIKMLI